MIRIPKERDAPAPGSRLAARACWRVFKGALWSAFEKGCQLRRAYSGVCLRMATLRVRVALERAFAPLPFARIYVRNERGANDADWRQIGRD